MHAFELAISGIRDTFERAAANLFHVDPGQVHVPKNISVPIVSDPTMPPTGIGEVGVPTVAPALANAIYAAGFGERLREIPFCKNKKLTVL